MFKLKTHLKKMIAISAAIFTMAAIVIIPAKGATLSEVYLSYITQYTYATAEATYYINQSVFSMLVILNSWILPDTSETTSGLQASFATATSTALQNGTTQTTLQRKLTQEYLGEDANSESTPYINDMTYQTMLGQPYLNPDPRIEKGEKNINSPYNFIKNASGITFTHPIPNSKWEGNTADKNNYENYYKTVSSIQTYNAYLLSQLYVDTTSQNSLTKQQNALMQQASNSDWFVAVASENIGIVLRQILMYNSQMYVLLTQLLQTQKQLVTAQAMTNTLLVMGNQFTETQLLMKARKE